MSDNLRVYCWSDTNSWEDGGWHFHLIVNQIKDLKFDLLLIYNQLINLNFWNLKYMHIFKNNSKEYATTLQKIYFVYYDQENP